MAKFFQKRQKEMEINPLYQLSVKVRNQLYNWIPERAIEDMMEIGMSPMQYSFYLVFEIVAQWVRDDLQSETTTIYRSVKEKFDFNETVSDRGKAETLKDTLWDFELRKKFLMAEIKRSGIAEDKKELEWMQKRENAYRLSPVQLQQLYDKDDFYIKKVDEFRRFRNSKHAPIDDVIKYYESLISHAEMCRSECDVKKRAISAINLNDFENKHLSLFLYRVAKYCADLEVKAITSAVEKNLLKLTAAVSCGENYKVTHKPVLFMQDYISAAVCGDAAIIDLYIWLELQGLWIRKEVLSNWLSNIQFGYQEIDDFISKWNCYNIFGLYSKINFEGDQQTKKTIALLRDLINRLTVDPLSC